MNFIKLTDQDGHNVLINIDKVLFIDIPLNEVDEGSMIIFIDGCISVNVKESIEQIEILLKEVK